MSLFGSHKSSNSLFSGSGGAPAPHHKFDIGQALLGFLGVPASYFHERHAEDAALQQQQQLDATIDADPNLPTPEAKAYAKANPKAYIDSYMQRFQPRQFGPGGGSLGLPDSTGHLSFQTAPRFDDNGTIYAPGDGTTAPQILQRGTKVVPVAPGGQAQVVDSISGAPVMQGAAPAAPTATPRPGEVQDGFMFRGGNPADPKSWVPVTGGASPSNGSATFP